MAFFRKEENQSPREKARTATMGIVARLGGCAYLIYIMMKLIRSARSGESGMSPTTAYVIVGVMLAATLVVLLLTISDFMRGMREHQFDSQRYYDEEFRKQGFTQDEIDSIRERCNETGETMEEVMRDIRLQQLLDEANTSVETGDDAGTDRSASLQTDENGEEK